MVQIPSVCQGELRGIRQLVPGVYWLEIYCPEIVEKIAGGGQFVMIEPLAHGSIMSRPFSIYDALAETGCIYLIIRDVGPNTHLYCQSLLVGTKLGLIGPLGKPFVMPHNLQKVWFVSGGCGIVPVHYLAVQLLRAKHQSVKVISGFTTKSQVFGISDLSVLLTRKMIVATDDGTQGIHGNAYDAFLKKLKEKHPTKPSAIFVCGPKVMMQRVARFAQSCQISCFVVLEETMACGIGACKGCAVPKADGSGVFHICQNTILPAQEVKDYVIPRD